MAEPDRRQEPGRHALRRAIRHELRQLCPGLRVIGEDFLAEASPIDLLATSPHGELTTVRIGSTDEDRQLLTSALADLAWLRPRIEDWLKLAPELEIDPSAEIRAMLLCPAFHPDTCRAVEGLPVGAIELVRYHCVRRRGPLAVLLDRVECPSLERAGIEESLSAPPAKRASPALISPPPSHESHPDSPRGGSQATDSSSTPPRPRLTAPPSRSCFRTGLVEADLETDRRPLPAHD